jgi:hypothetical protein
MSFSGIGNLSTDVIRLNRERSGYRSRLIVSMSSGWLFLSKLRSRIACSRFAHRYSFCGRGQPSAISFQPTANSGLPFCATSGDNLSRVL